MFRLVNLQPMACASLVEMVEPIVLNVNPNDKALITLGKLILSAITWNVWRDRNSLIFRIQNQIRI